MQHEQQQQCVTTACYVKQRDGTVSIRDSTSSEHNASGSDTDTDSDDAALLTEETIRQPSDICLPKPPYKQPYNNTHSLTITTFTHTTINNKTIHLLPTC